DGGAEWPGGAAYDVLLHELRAPLGAAGNALEAVVRTSDRTSGAHAEQIAPMLQLARLGVTEAQSLVRRFSQLRMIDNGAAQPTLRAVSVMKTIERAVALLQTTRVRIVANEDAPPAAADQLWLTHTLTNLIENALKYSRPSDLVQVIVTCAPADRVHISVLDAGCGIPPDQQQAIFRPYVGGARSDDLTSQGLGLSIARYCVTAMGGDIWVESDGHRGATLSFTLPLASP